MSKNYFLLLIIFSFLGSQTMYGFSHDANPVKPTLNFIENKGQWAAEARYKAEIPNGALFITDRGFVYNFVKEEDVLRLDHKRHEEGSDLSDLKDEVIHSHAYRVNFVGANSGLKYKSVDKRNQYNNYFIGNDPSKWAGNVGLFGKVIQENVYDGIDVAVYSSGQSYKYDFIVSPGSDPSKIALSFDGVQPRLTKDGDLLIQTSVNEVIERAPYTYQMINQELVLVKSHYMLKGEKLTFSFPDGYNASYPLIIDPDLVFATFSGATSTSAYAYTTTYDVFGNLYAGADVWSIGWPITTGAAQVNYGGGGHEVGINKYNADGKTLLYSTYFGGSNWDSPHAMRVNDKDELVIVGATQSSNIPTTAGCYSNKINGIWDMFVAHFNSSGQALIGSTYIGGSGIDPFQFTINSTATMSTNLSSVTSPVELDFDQKGNIWVVGNTQSTDFPVTANAHQSTLSGGIDGVVFQLDPTCSNLMYSSYLGGTGNDGPTSLAIDEKGNIIIAGITGSTNFPTTSGVMNPSSLGGLYDGFVTILSPITGSILHSTYIGTDQVDHVVSLQVDKFNDIYILGRTLGNYPITPGAWNSSPNADCFIDKLKPDLSASLMSTRIGNPQTQGSRYFPSAFLVDICENIYVAGFSAISGLPLTDDAYQTTLASFWFCVMEPNFNDILYGSYFGQNGDHNHIGVNRMDPAGIVYHSMCKSSAFPNIPAGVWSPVKKTNGQDIFSFKFAFEASGVNAKFTLDPTVGGKDSGCAPYTIGFINNSIASNDFIWNFGDGSPSTSQKSPTHTYTKPGTYVVTLYAENVSACVTNDTTYRTITVLEIFKPDITVHDTLVCNSSNLIDIGVTVNNPTPNNRFLWTSPGGGIVSSPTDSVVTVNPSINNVYYITVSDTIPGICGVSTTDTITIDFSPRVLNILTNDTIVCEGESVVINAEATPGYTFRWAPSKNVSDSTVLEPVITVHESTVYTLTGSYPGCPDTSQLITINMEPKPYVNLTRHLTACEGVPVALESYVEPFRDDYTYEWSPGRGLSDSTGPNAEFIADVTSTYTLTVTSPLGCFGRDHVEITVIPSGFGDAAADTGYCPPGAVALWAGGGTNYEWIPAYGLDDATSATPIASPATTTTYTVLIKEEHGCVDSQEVLVEVYPLAVIEMPDSISIYPGEEYHIEPRTNALYFSWFPPSGLNSATISDPVMKPAVRTRYFVTAKTEHGCEVKDSIDVLVQETVLDMPNAFTPGNGINNTFKASKRGIVQLKEFSVFNRWGNKVFTTTNIDEGWDGMLDGKPQPMGVYIYIIDALTDNNQSIRMQGNVTLIR